jgi:hypothetical protein
VEQLVAKLRGYRISIYFGLPNLFEGDFFLKINLFSLDEGSDYYEKSLLFAESARNQGLPSLNSSNIDSTKKFITSLNIQKQT